MRQIIYFIAILLLAQKARAQNTNEPYVLVLGVAQDGGYPHMACIKTCCATAWKNNKQKRFITSLALVDPATKKWWLFEATPDIREQLQYFRELTNNEYAYLPAGIFITHAHIGHYTGLMQLGREVISTKNIPVYVLPKMKTFLETNGPWSQLVTLKNIELNTLKEYADIALSPQINVSAFTVPHRDEYSETAGFKIFTSANRYLFIPDINKWTAWKRNIVDEVSNASIAFLDATFYDSTEIPGRSIKEIPHPLVIETMALFQNTHDSVKSKIHFIHFNHTNPLLWDKKRKEKFSKEKIRLATQGQRL